MSDPIVDDSNIRAITRGGSNRSKGDSTCETRSLQKRVLHRILCRGQIHKATASESTKEVQYGFERLWNSCSMELKHELINFLKVAWNSAFGTLRRHRLYDLVSSGLSQWGEKRKADSSAACVRSEGGEIYCMLRTSQEGEEENTHKQTKGPRYIYLSSWPFCHDHDVYMFFVFCPLMSERGYEALFCLSKVFTLQSILSFYVTTVGESKCAMQCNGTAFHNSSLIALLKRQKSF